MSELGGILGGLLFTWLCAYVAYFCNREKWLADCAKAILVHREGIIAAKEAKRKAKKMNVILWEVW